MKETFSNLKRVYQYGKMYKKYLIIISLLSLLFVGINIILPILSAKLLVNLTDGIFEELIGVSVIILIIEFMGGFNNWLIRRNTQKFFIGTTKNIQIEAAHEILKIEQSDIDKSTSGTFIQRLGNDADEMSRVFTRGLGYLTNILTDIGVFVAIFVINIKVFLFYVITSLIMTVIHLYKVKSVNEEDKKHRKMREKASGLIGELVRGVRDIKMLHAKDSFVREIDETVDDLAKTLIDFRNVDMNYNLVLNWTSTLIEYALILLLVVMIAGGEITISTALILYNFKSRVLANLINHVGYLLTEIKGFNLSSNRVFSLLGSDEFRKETFGTKHIDSIKGNFEFKDVHFSYGDNKVLDGINFKINENETVAFVGKSGAGKTTIFSLLCKLYDIQDGDILIDGVSIKELDEYSIRNNITMISQNPYIFNMSIKDNLRLVKDDLTDEEMYEACRMACLTEFIESLPEKYDTVVGEGGVTLSGGQRQRLAIARAFVQNTKIILFDEATSALDNETQKFIQQAITNMKDKYTILIIAHRLSTIVNSDRIMLVDKGKVMAEGSHLELLNNNDTYKALYETEVEK